MRDEVDHLVPPISFEANVAPLEVHGCLIIFVVCKLYEFFICLEYHLFWVQGILSQNRFPILVRVVKHWILIISEQLNLIIDNEVVVYFLKQFLFKILHENCVVHIESRKRVIKVSKPIFVHILYHILVSTHIIRVKVE